MHGGSIRENASSALYTSYSGGVCVESGTFTMSGGSIVGNSSFATTFQSYSGGVYVGSGTFTMSGGSITGNSSSSSSSVANSGGVYVNGGTFTMNGGSITGNATNGSGGGVYLNDGTFTMSGGSITGNSSYGVFVGSGNNITFTMSSNARIDPSNRVYLPTGSSIAIAGAFGGNDTVAVLDLGGDAVVWLGKSVLLRATGYTGAIPAGRFGLGVFGMTTTPIGNNYIIDSNGKLANK
jgi:hypothetical protein